LRVDEARHLLETAELVCPAASVSAAITRLAREISAELADSHPLVLCVMRGAVVFAGQLLPQLRFPLEFDYLEVTRYGAATRGGAIAWKVMPVAAIAGRVVLVLDDVLDEGGTLAAIREKQPATADFVGVKLPNRYLIGCGMDAGGAWRNLPEIYALKDGEG
jgi:hypoxanthine phosphoribosyltransferase